jgi:uncharacterized damage-inducible protein DinB
MMIEYNHVRNYLFIALRRAPNLFSYILQGVGEDEADIRPDPERFTIREAMAHMAAWEPVILSRLQATRDQDEPTLPIVDETAMLAGYANSNPIEQVELFGKRRAETIAFLEAVGPQQWGRIAHRINIGPMTLEANALLVPLHDMYHYDQIVSWREQFGKPNCQS